ncbi:MAG: anti-sigma factor family protein [Terriglobales bacterium]
MTISCRQVTDWSSEYLDGELETARTASVSAHAAACERCRALLHSLRTTARLFGDESLLAMPSDAHDRLHAALRDAAGRIAAGQSPERVAKPAIIPPPARRWWQGAFHHRAAWAAAVIVIVAVLGVLHQRAGAITISGWLMDSHCLHSYQARLGEHSAACLLQCAEKKQALGVVNAKGQFLPFDARGRRQAVEEVAAAHKPDHVWVTVRGKRAGTKAAPLLDVEQIELTAPGSTAALSR